MYKQPFRPAHQPILRGGKNHGTVFGPRHFPVFAEMVQIVPDQGGQRIFPDYLVGGLADLLRVLALHLTHKHVSRSVKAEGQKKIAIVGSKVRQKSFGVLFRHIGHIPSRDIIPDDIVINAV